jgi:hypothetical protein
MAGYATETPQVSARFLNQSFLNAIEGGRTKEAADEGTNFIREIVRQASAVREILPPVGLQDDEIDRDERTDEPKKIIEKEPQSVATFVEFQGTPSAYWFRGPRYAVFFGKILSPKATKSKFQLMTYQNDIRKILADNFVKDMADQEDKYWRRQCLVLTNKNPGAQRTNAPAFTSSAFKRGFQSLLDRRRPIGKMLMTKSLFMEAIDLPATTVGNAIAEAHYKEGIENEERLFGVPVVTTVKSDIYDPREVWVYSPQNFLGNFFLLQDATLFIKQEADMIEFFTYEAPGIGIGNRLSMQHIVFPARDA